jgi:hypothetical protein
LLMTCRASLTSTSVNMLVPELTGMSRDSWLMDFNNCMKWVKRIPIFQQGDLESYVENQPGHRMGKTIQI